MLSDNLPLRRETAERGTEPPAESRRASPLFVRSQLPTAIATHIALYAARHLSNRPGTSTRSRGRAPKY